MGLSSNREKDGLFGINQKGNIREKSGKEREKRERGRMTGR